MENHVVVCSRSFSKNFILKNELQNFFPSVEFNDQGLTLKDGQLVNFAKNATHLVIGLEKIDKNLLKELPSLKVISKFGVGLDNVDLKAMKEKNIKIGWFPGVNKRSVAELTISNAINLIRNISSSNINLKAGNWKNFQGKQLNEITFGIIGCGNVGKEVATLLKPFGPNILAYDKIDYNEFYTQCVCLV